MPSVQQVLESNPEFDMGLWLEELTVLSSKADMWDKEYQEFQSINCHDNALLAGNKISEFFDRLYVALNKDNDSYIAIASNLSNEVQSMLGYKPIY